MASDEVRVTCDGGMIRFVYEDRLLPLHALGETTVTRVSHVEPARRCNRCHRRMLGTTAHDGACECGGLIEAAGWEARMDPGPVLGPFPTRTEALTAEREWLRAHRGL